MNTDDFLSFFSRESSESNSRGEELFSVDESGDTICHTEALEKYLEDESALAEKIQENVQENTLSIHPEVDEDEFFTDENGMQTIVTRYDLEKAVPAEEKPFFEELDRYWVNKPYSFVSIFRSKRENEIKYYLVEPYLTDVEADIEEYIEEKLRKRLKYDTNEIKSGESNEEQEENLERETYELLDTYGMYSNSQSLVEQFQQYIQTVANLFGQDYEITEKEKTKYTTRPESQINAELGDVLTEHQVEKLLYYLKRDYVGNQRIDGITKDLSVEDISCDGYNSPVFVYHSDYEQIISNVYHGKEELDEFVTRLAQNAGKGISKRKPQVDATLPNGSRAQLTLGEEVSDHGTNYTIRQFKEVPFTPLDLINWHTFSMDQMAFLWLAIENHKNLIFAGGTASGKTTSLNAVSLFIPSSSKIVSIEDTREVELPQRNWIASVTRPSFTGNDEGNVTEFDLLEAALRQRPDYIVMGEIRGEEGRTLFQVMSTGHTTYTTFHADTVSEVIKRFTTDPINVSKTMFTALDLISIQTQTSIDGRKVRRNKVLTEINHYDTTEDNINVQDVYEWQAETDQFLQMSESNIIQDIKFERGWDETRVNNELDKRRLVLAYLMLNGLNKYKQVAATLQAFINDPETILTLIANENLKESLHSLQKMQSIELDISEEAESRAGRPDIDDEMEEQCRTVIQDNQHLLEQYVGKKASINNAITATNPQTPPNKTDTQSDGITVVSDGEEIQEDEILATLDVEDLSDVDDEMIASEFGEQNIPEDKASTETDPETNDVDDTSEEEDTIFGDSDA